MEYSSSSLFIKVSSNIFYTFLWTDYSHIFLLKIAKWLTRDGKVTLKNILSCLLKSDAYASVLNEPTERESFKNKGWRFNKFQYVYVYVPLFLLFFLLSNSFNTYI